MAKVSKGLSIALAAAAAALLLALAAPAARAHAGGLAAGEGAPEVRALLYDSRALVFQPDGVPDPARGRCLASWGGLADADFYFGDPPWQEYAGWVDAVAFERGAAPSSLRGWFENEGRQFRFKSVDMRGLDGSRLVDAREAFFYNEELEAVDMTGVSLPALADASSMFSDCSSLRELRGAGGAGMGSLKTAVSMFSGCKRLASLDLSGWDTRSLRDASFMFAGCRRLARMGVARWDTRSLRTAYYMFAFCKSVKTAEVGAWDTRSLRDVRNMFYRCSSLERPRVSKWDTRNLRDATAMFYRCASLERAGVSAWRAPRLKRCEVMFYGCSRLRSASLAGWSSARLRDAEGMFQRCPALRRVTLGPCFSRVPARMLSGTGGDLALEVRSASLSAPRVRGCAAGGARLARGRIARVAVRAGSPRADAALARRYASAFSRANTGSAIDARVAPARR